MLSQSGAVVGLISALWLGLVALLMHRRYEAAQQKQVVFLAPMSTDRAKRRIRSAKSEIWSFQISGSEFTANSIETYEAWLSEDHNRILMIAFANPDNESLLKNIVKLSGVSKLSSEDHAYEHLRQLVRTTLEMYIRLRENEKFKDRVDVRVYNFSPPYSIHAVDPDPQDDRPGSVFVELYLPDLPRHERPCMLLGQEHKSYRLYRNKSLAWFEDAEPAIAGSASRGAPPAKTNQGT